MPRRASRAQIQSGTSNSTDPAPGDFGFRSVLQRTFTDPGSDELDFGCFQRSALERHAHAASTRLDMRTLELAHDVALIRLSWLDARQGTFRRRNSHERFVGGRGIQGHVAALLAGQMARSAMILEQRRDVALKADLRRILRELRPQHQPEYQTER